MRDSMISKCQVIVRGVLIAAAILPTLAFAAPAQDIPGFESRFTNAPPKIDGKLNDVCWKDAVLTNDFWLVDGSATAGGLASGYVAHDQSNLYVAFRSKSDKTSGLRSGSVKRDQGVWGGPNLQVFVDPSGPSPYYCFTLNSRNTQEDARSYDTSWNGRWQNAVYIAPDESYWQAEIAIPFSVMDLSRVKDGNWRLNITCVVVVGGKQQILTWAPTFNNFNAPALFGKLSLPKVRWDDYRVSLDAAIKTGRPGVFLVDARTRQQAGKPRGLRLALDFKTPSGGTARNTVALPPSVFEVRTQLSAKTYEMGEHQFLLAIFDAKTNRPVAQQWLNMTSPRPLTVWTDRSLYSGAGSATISVETWIADSAGKPFSVAVVDKDGTAVKRQAGKLDAMGRGSVSLDIAALPDGEYRVKAQVAGKAAQCPLVKLAPQAGTVYHDDHGVIYKDNKPFFPFGMYYIQSHLGENGLLDEYAEAGFNTIVWEWVDAPNYISALNEMDKHGISLIASVQNEYYFSELRTKMQSQPQDVQLAAYEKHVQAMTRTVADAAPRNLIGWYVWDEPSLEGLGFVKGIADATKAGDPRRPGLVCLCISNYLQGFSDIVDILAPDPYPGFPGGPITKVSNFMIEARRVTGGRKPVIAVLQSFSEPPGQEGIKNMPTPEELRCMAYLSIVHGAKGILFFSYDYNTPMREANPLLWAEMKRVAGEVRDLAPVLFKDSGKLSAKQTAGSEAVHIRAIQDGKGVCIVAVNTDRKPAKGVTWKLSGIPDGPMGVAGEHRSVNVSKGQLKDDFPPLAVRTYRRK